MFFMVSDLECSTLISATNIFYVSGSTDPWHSLAVVKDPVAGSKGILIEGADHIDFMFLHGYNDEVNKRVNDTREQIKELLAKALGKKIIQFDIIITDIMDRDRIRMAINITNRMAINTTTRVAISIMVNLPRIRKL